MNKEEIVQTLEEYAELLRLDDQKGRAHAREKAARSIKFQRFMPSDPSRIDNVGYALRDDVADLQADRDIEELNALRNKYDYYVVMRDVDHIGPSRAKEIHNTFNVSSLERLSLIAEEGDLTLVSGIGESTQENIKQSIETLM